MTDQEVARDGKYLKIGGNNNVQLKHTSPGYTQVQLGAAQYSWCDFVIFPQKEPGMHSHRKNERMMHHILKVNLKGH